MYKFHKEIKDPLLLKIQSISDDRGLLVPFTEEIDHELFRRSYILENYGKGVIRGLHYHMKETKVFTTASGAAKFVTVKLPPEIAERNSESEIKEFLKADPGVIKTWVMSSRHHCALCIPAFHASGWINLEEHTVLVSLSNLRFEEAVGDDIRIDPFIIGEEYWRTTPR